MAQIENTPRRALMKIKRGNLNKYEEVLVVEKYLGRGRHEYRAFRKGDEQNSVKVTRSEFDFMEQTEFVVYVTRISHSTKRIVVSAKDRKAAEALASDKAGDLEFSEQDAEYKVDMAMTKEEHQNTFGNDGTN